MRHIVVPLLALLVVGSSAALPLVAPAPASLHERFDATLAACAGAAECAAARTRALTDALIADLASLPPDVASTVAWGVAAQGYAMAELDATRSPTLEAALLRLYDASGVVVERDEVARQSAALPPSDAAALAALVDAVADAQLASARILAADDLALLRDDLRTRMLQLTLEGDRTLVDVLARADMAQAAAAAMRVSRAMAALPPLAGAAGCAPALSLPFVRVAGPCDDVHDATLLILVDQGGNDAYLNNAGAGIAGVGVGIAIDQGAGSDTYRAAGQAQGFGLAGVGILVDEGGSDSYTLTSFGQAFGVAGVGILHDQGAGNDRYESPQVSSSIATKGGGLGGIGILRDDGGVDLYQQDGLDGFVYGAAGGLGAILEYGTEDGDAYVSRDLSIVLLGMPLGEFVGPIQVSAEVSATAILYEEGGDTSYSCGDHVRQGCQGAGGVGGLALHLDLAGDDVYRLGQSISPRLAGIPVFPSGQGIAYGEGSLPPGPGLGILRDLGGDDVYAAGPWAQGYATGGLGLLLDEAGADAYSGAVPLVGARVDGARWADGLALGVGIDA